MFVDPDGVLADPTYDLGVVLRDWCAQLLDADAAALAGRYCRLLAAETELDETAIWEGCGSPPVSGVIRWSAWRLGGVGSPRAWADHGVGDGPAFVVAPCAVDEQQVG